MGAIVEKFVRQPLVAPMKRGLVLACLLLLTACGSAVNPTAQPTTSPATTSPTLVVTTAPASPTPEPAPQLDFAAGMTAAQQQQAQTFFDNHLLAASELPAAVHLLTAVAADGRTILYTDPPGRDDLARAYGLDGDGNPTPTIILESPYTPGEPLLASVAGAREVNTAVTQIAVNEQGVIVGLDDNDEAVAFVAPQAGPNGQLVAPWTALEPGQMGVVANINGLHLSIITDQHGRMLQLIPPHIPEGAGITALGDVIQINGEVYMWNNHNLAFAHAGETLTNATIEAVPMKNYYGSDIAPIRAPTPEGVVYWYNDVDKQFVPEITYITDRAVLEQNRASFLSGEREIEFNELFSVGDPTLVSNQSCLITQGHTTKVAFNCTPIESGYLSDNYHMQGVLLGVTKVYDPILRADYFIAHFGIENTEGSRAEIGTLFGYNDAPGLDSFNYVYYKNNSNWEHLNRNSKTETTAGIAEQFNKMTGNIVRFILYVHSQREPDSSTFDGRVWYHFYNQPDHTVLAGWLNNQTTLESQLIPHTYIASNFGFK